MRHAAIVIAAAAAAAAVLTGAAPAAATVDLTATGVRIGDHPAHVRVVVDFTDGTIRAPAVMATDPSPADGRVRIVVPGRNAQAQAPALRRHGVRARVLPGRNRVVVVLDVRPRRFKYAGYAVYRGPERLVVDLFKRRPPAAGMSARYGRPGCIGFTSIAARPGAVTVRGTESGIFEHSFPVLVRTADGRVAGRRIVSAAGGRWRTRVPVRVGRPRTGLLEAAELSAKDGALSCLEQAPVALRP